MLNLSVWIWLVQVRYEIPSVDHAGQRRRLSDMFGSIEAAKQRLMIDDYSLSQTS